MDEEEGEGAKRAKQANRDGVGHLQVLEAKGGVSGVGGGIHLRR